MKKSGYKILFHISRIILGMTFVFSGFVKGQDPLGTTFKLEDYFIAFGWQWAMPFALPLSILLCTFEFGLGVSLLFQLYTRLTHLLVLLTMLFFTGLTLHDAIYNPVPDCGCFGDAIKLTNWQTFYKNIVLLFFAILLPFAAYHSKMKHKRRLPGFVLTFILFAGFSLWSYYNLPLLDFLPWKKGTDFKSQVQQPVTYYLTYKNKLTGEQKEYVSSEIPYNDSIWMGQWEFVSTRVYDPNTHKKPELVITDSIGTNITDHYLLYPGYQLIATIYDLNETSSETIFRLMKFLRLADEAGHGVLLLVSATNEEISRLKTEYDAGFDIYSADDIQLKMMVRANPGIILLYNGKIIHKLNARSLPEYADFSAKWLKPQ